MRTDFATKLDIERAVQSLRSEMATKSELKAVHDDLKHGFERLAIEVVNLGAIVRSKMATKDELSERNDRVLRTVDHFSAKLEIYDRESAIFPGTLDDHGRRLDAHERRLHILESLERRLRRRGKPS